MKKSVLLILMAFACFSSFAQVTRTAHFDFANPKSLMPSVILPNDQDEVYVWKEIFTNLDVSISFSRKRGTGPCVKSFVNPYTNEQSYYLAIFAQDGLTIHVPESCSIDKVSFTDNSVVGDLRVIDETLGEQSEGYKVWTNTNHDIVHDLSYRNSFATSQLKHIEVDYTVPSIVLEATPSLADSCTIAKFDSLMLTFRQKMLVNDDSNLVLSNGTEEIHLSASVKDNIVMLHAPTTIVEEGTYTVTIPARSFKDVEGFENKEIKLTFTIKTPFDFVSIVPDSGVVESIPSRLVATFPSKVGVIDDAKMIRLWKSGQDMPYCRVMATRLSDTEVAFDLDLGEDQPAIVERGEYTLCIPAATFWNHMKGDTEFERCNDSLAIVYTIAEPQIFQDARDLLELAGVGYPTKESTAYVNLYQLLYNSEKEPTVEELQAAIDAYYVEKNVALLDSAKWYKIAVVNPEGQKKYLTCSSDKTVSFVEDENSAIVFEALVDSTITLRTNAGDSLSVSGFTRDLSQAQLTLSKLDLDNCVIEEDCTFDAKSVMGLFSINGLIKNSVGDETYINAFVKFEEGIFGSDYSVKKTYFNNTFSSAFMFFETEAPAPEIEVKETQCKLASNTVSIGKDMLKVCFPEVEDVRLAENATQAYFACMNGSDTARVEGVDVVFTPVEDGLNNKFNVAIDFATVREYYLIIPEGTFVYDMEGKTVKTQKITLKFIVQGFDVSYNEFQTVPTTKYAICDTDLNNVLIKDPCLQKFDGFVANPDVTVTLVPWDNGNKVIRTGHLAPYEDPEDSQTKTYKVKFDEPIKRGELQPEKYALILPEGAIGDNNYGRYLKGDTSISPSECKINRRFWITYDVNNEVALDIADIATDNSSTAIYTLQGTRVSHMKTPGIYIVNGRKVVVR